MCVVCLHRAFTSVSEERRSHDSSGYDTLYRITRLLTALATDDRRRATGDRRCDTVLPCSARAGAACCLKNGDTARARDGCLLAEREPQLVTGTVSIASD